MYNTVPSYTSYLWTTIRTHGIKRALRVVWLMETFGMLKIHRVLIGIVLVIAGLFTGWNFAGLLMIAGGAYVVGMNDARFCPCEPECDCDDPRMVFDGIESQKRDETDGTGDEDDSIEGDGFRLIA